MGAVKSLGLIVLIILIGCKESTVGPEDKTVDAQFDLQSGFEERWVQIRINDEVKFEAGLSPILPLAGPIASFNTNIPRGMNQIWVSWRSLAVAEIVPMERDSVTFEIGAKDKYYMGLSIANDSLSVIVQDNPFKYL